MVTVLQLFDLAVPEISVYTLYRAYIANTSLFSPH